jgi:hypothetical protein
MINNVITKEVLQESCSCFCSMAGCPILQKPETPFIPFQQSNEPSPNI